ncbi:GNAT family N-acetyltransferase [Streptomonospora arabica]|uniref:GNAT family N-acetyltransferase n=1 Tax=Streptomonospora arabica TaxID=412417 RepID=A0ABV9SP89_9ACTN
MEHAREAFPLFNDEHLHAWTGGMPASLDELTARYRRQAVGRSPDGTQGWLNWILRRDSDGLLVGTVQATLHRSPLHGPLYERLFGRLRRALDDRRPGRLLGPLSEPFSGPFGPLRRPRLEAELAWMVGTDHQGLGYAREGALAMARWLATPGVVRLTAHIRPGHRASEGVARSLGLAATDAVSDGETVWASAAP